MNAFTRSAAVASFALLFAATPVAAQQDPAPDAKPAAPVVAPGTIGKYPLGPHAFAPDDGSDAPAPDTTAPVSAPEPAAPPELLGWVGRNPLLRGVAFRTEPHFDPVDVLVQPPTPADESHLTRVAWTLGTWARALDVMFVSKYAAAARRAARPGCERLAVLIVSQPELFATLRGHAGARDAWDAVAFYDPSLPAVIVLDADSPAIAPGIDSLVRPMLHAAVHALMDAYADPSRPAPAWLAEGLAERLASHAPVFSAQVQSLRVFDQDSFVALAKASLDRTQRIACLRPLSDLVTVGALSDLDARTAGLPVEASMPLLGLAREASLFLEWLDEGEPSQPERMTHMLVQWLAGKPDARVPQPADADADSADFVEWAQEQLTKRVKLSGSAFTLQPETAAPDEIRPGVVAQPSDLAVKAGGLDLERALAFELASHGDLAGAAARCAELSGLQGLSAADATSLKTDQRLLLAVAALRHRWLAAHVGKLIEFHDGDTILRTTLERIDGDKLIVKDKGKERPLPETALVPAVLAAQLIAPGNVYAGTDDEARSFAWLLAPDPDWKEKTAARVRKDAGPAGLAVLELRASHDPLVTLGRAVAHLQDLAGARLPLDGATEPERDAWLARFKTALADRALPVTAAHLPALRALASRVLGARFDASPLKHVTLHGKLEDLGHGRIRASWNFADAAQLQDWVARPFDARLFAPYPPLGSAPTPAGLSVEDGWVVARGSGDWRCRLAVAAPFTIDYDLRYDYTPSEQQLVNQNADLPDGHLIAELALRACSDDYGSGLDCVWLGHLILIDKRAAIYDRHDSSYERIFFDTKYHVHVEHDGQRVRALVDGQEVAALSAHKLVRGAFELWHHTERPIALDNLVVEGALDVAALAPARDAWVAGELAALGAGN